MLTREELLYMEQAIYKAVADDVSARDPESLRSAVDAEIIGDYERDGIKSRDARVNGEKVGTYTVRVKKPSASDVPVIRDRGAFVAWLAENVEYATEYAMDSPGFLVYVIGTGELPDGVEMEHVEAPGGVAGTTLKVDVAKVRQAMGGELPNALAGLLGATDEKRS